MVTRPVQSTLACYYARGRREEESAFRAKLNEKKEKQQRINSPLVRYNDSITVCRVCDVVLKSSLGRPPSFSQTSSGNYRLLCFLPIFFDNADKKKPKTGSDLVKSGGSANTRVVESLHSQNPKDGLSDKIQPADVKDEYKEFEKLIQEDLQEVDDRMEEDEIDAAEVIEI
ncbi:hypothetical protein LWI28_019241 [Acer negundo]|uniref:Uncharacterized protein n=1 Tax=Acer negundo TaxID=4023 RepID=A0AAD5INQ8_ACENE|nr:hypothetical protein LWI28_019241 [Acer negundo]